MEAIELLAECTARGIRLEPRGDRLGIIDPFDDALKDRIAAHKADLLALLSAEQSCGCARGGDPNVYRLALDGSGWSRRCEWRPYLLDLAAMAGYPRLGLSPMLLTIQDTPAAWSELARGASVATIGVAMRRLRELLGERAGLVKEPRGIGLPCQSP